MNTTIISGRLVRNPGYNEVENEKGLHKIAKFVLAVRRNYSDEVSFIPVKAFLMPAFTLRKGNPMSFPPPFWILLPLTFG